MQRSNKLFAHVTLALLLTLSSCGNRDGVSTAPRTTTPYFSLADYFGQEAERLQQHNPEIVKTVSQNGEEELKKIRLADWQGELALFIDADINKPAWQNSYRVDSTQLAVTYTSIDPALRTKEIRVEKSKTGIIKHVRVTNHVSNMLYQTDEQLDYYVDSLYRIVKQQNVRIIGESQYTVSGAW